MSTTLTIIVLLKHLFSNLTLPEAKKEKKNTKGKLLYGGIQCTE